MSVLEMVKAKVKELADPDGPASELLHTAKSSLAHGLDGAGKFVDEKTGGKYASTIHNGVGKAKEFLGEQQKDAEGSAKDQGASASPDAGGAAKPSGIAVEGSAPQPPGSPEPSQTPGPSQPPESPESPESPKSGEPPQPQP
jgi:hypothetical protein